MIDIFVFVQKQNAFCACSLYDNVHMLLCIEWSKKWKWFKKKKRKKIVHAFCKLVTIHSFWYDTRTFTKQKRHRHFLKNQIVMRCRAENNITYSSMMMQTIFLPSFFLHRFISQAQYIFDDHVDRWRKYFRYAYHSSPEVCINFGNKQSRLWSNRFKLAKYLKLKLKLINSWKSMHVEQSEISLMRSQSQFQSKWRNIMIKDLFFGVWSNKQNNIGSSSYSFSIYSNDIDVRIESFSCKYFPCDITLLFLLEREKERKKMKMRIKQSI